MTEELSAQQPVATEGGNPAVVGRIAAVAVAMIAFAWGGWQASGGNLYATLCGAQLALLAGGGLFLVDQYRRRWTEPLRKLAEIVPQVRAGQVPIEELSAISGPLAPVAMLLKELMRDLRRQRAEVAALENETRQKIANKTDALERTIGSLRRQATRDVLTGLYNRRMLDEYLPRTIKQCKESNTSLCVLMIDVDHFKLLNDTLGHSAGDDLLKNIGQLIRSAIRDKDLAFRCGGDEFIVQLEGYDAEAGQAVADRLTELVDALAKTLRVTPGPRLSIGVATLADCSKATPEALLELADKLLYEVKGARRRAVGSLQHR